MDFETLKTSSSNFDKLTKALETNLKPEDQSNKRKYEDDRFWKPELDKTGNGFAVIRFLPAVENEDLPWQRVWSHAFQDKGGWYIENSLTTLSQKDPVSEENTRLWNTGLDSDKEIARKRKRKLSYYSNIYVVSDPQHPENEGRVFLYKYGKKIFDKLVEAMQPAFADETPLDPFNFWKGADFKLKIRKLDGYWNYDKSEFAASGTLGGFDDSKLESIWKQGYSLTEFESAKNFKDYDALKKRLDLVLGLSIPHPTIEDESHEDLPKGTGQSWGQEVSNFREKAVASSPVQDEEDTLSYFSRLAEED